MAGDCGSTCPVEGGFYAYDPNVGGNAVLLATFALLVPVVLFLGIRFRTPVFSATLATGLLLAVAGFLGRILLHGSPRNQGLFFLSLLGTLLGPVCISAANFLTLPHILSVYGDHISPLQPVVAGVVLYGLAAVAAVVQVVGVAFTAYDLSGLNAKRTGGTSLIAGGLGVQLLALVCFSLLHFWFTLAVRTRVSGLDAKHAAVYRSVGFKRFLLVAYSAYRIVEMATGVDGTLFQNQIAFMILDGVLPLFSAALITIQHPGATFGSAWGPTSPLRVQKRRAAPAPSGRSRRYDPSIRSQISPTSPGNLRYSNPQEMQAGSPGLPSNPKPAGKSTSPMPSPTGTALTGGTTDTTEVKKSWRAERRTYAPPKKELVEKDTLW
ncbi:Sphingoid long-chain base transporter-like protein [Hapsidospora chrysogenum ATCC 11550]|uniref:Sphingoid long-chain base transporter-like protein n=1 Tax=Hapsidospora chrysogenum (strain ATCC 11550 / CBS 779.69 / DSM 880 / IAM 14645 / JCM 23072 / IMI 49137) TaxID=857340 RepID=A0A086TBU2_HAPC1|nr:Sphingoid long-chain base transporter-like protein [Hapsidospora chrysogenum ATCC 11550]